GLATRAEPAYRLTQILPRLWQRPVGSWADATDLPAALRAQLADTFPLAQLTCDAAQQSSDGTEKFLWKLSDGQAIESVLIPERTRRTLCISSQVGCALGCVFCATGRMGFRRNLSVAEIAGQVREAVRRDAGAGAVPPPGDTRVRIDRREERLAHAGGRAGAAGAPARRARKPAAAAPGRRTRSDPERAPAHDRLRAAAQGSRRRSRVAAQPRVGHQRGVRPATGGTRGAAQSPRRGARSRRVAGCCRTAPRRAP